jgi:hypothetical protein
MGMDEAQKQSDYLLKNFAEDPLDGIILLGRLDDVLLRRVVGRIAKYVVCMDRYYDSKADYVGTDASKSILLAVEHLYKIGYREYGLLYGGDDLRRGACLQWLEEHELSVMPEWQINGEFTLSVAQNRVAEVLAEHKPPEAIIAANDEMAIGCIRALQQAGYRIPEDVAVTGHDDILLAAYVEVPLTTVHIYKTGCYSTKDSNFICSQFKKIVQLFNCLYRFFTAYKVNHIKNRCFHSFYTHSVNYIHSYFSVVAGCAVFVHFIHQQAHIFTYVFYNFSGNFL